MSKGYVKLQIETQQVAVYKPTIAKTSSSILDHSLQLLMSLIFDFNSMSQEMKQIGYDSKKIPLGKLGKKTILDGYEVLDRIKKVLNNQSKEKLNDLSSNFYSIIPHDFGFSHMSNFIIDNKTKVKEKEKMLESLNEIEIAKNIIDLSQNSPDTLNEYYKNINCELKIISENSHNYEIIEKYFQNTNKNNIRYTISNVWEVNRKGESEKFTKTI